ncbi:MAG: peptidylprolyl isomerase [Bacteroidota bacterium]|jgi:peptidyl-prolyl cis-trans isomerase SurA
MTLKFLKQTKIFLLIVVFFSNSRAQDLPKPKGIIVDKVAAVVGKNLILASDIENQYSQALSSGETPPPKCSVLEELLFTKLLVHQAEVDSIEIPEKQVQQELDQRMRYYVAQVGSEEKLEEYYGKSIAQLKEDFKEDVREMLLARQVQQGITADVKVTPSEVRTMFNSFSVDSLPLLNAEMEIAQVVKKIEVNEDEKNIVREKIRKIRDRIVDGEDFATLAVLYSEDTESAKRGGELGFVGRNDLVPEFAAEAFNLKGKEISRIVESQFGFHIIQLIKRRGEMINVRHILISPKFSSADLKKAQLELDSIKNQIASGKITFEEAALKFSDDTETKLNGGLLINPATGTTKFDVAEIEPGLFFILDKLKLGEVSDVTKQAGSDNKPAFKLLTIKSKSEPHRANLKDDYQRLQNIALQQKQAKTVNTWINKKRKQSYIKVTEEYMGCQFRNTWFDKEKQQ